MCVLRPRISHDSTLYEGTQEVVCIDYINQRKDSNLEDLGKDRRHH